MHRLPSTTRISSVSSSIPRWILRQTLRFVRRCLRVCHAPSPSTLMPLLSTSRCNSPLATGAEDSKDRVANTALWWISGQSPARCHVADSGLDIAPKFQGYAVSRRPISTSSSFMPSMRSRQLRMFFRRSIRSCDLARSAMLASPISPVADHEISGRRRPLWLEAHARAGRKAGQGQHCDRALSHSPHRRQEGFERVSLPMEGLRGSTLSVESVRWSRYVVYRVASKLLD